MFLVGNLMDAHINFDVQSVVMLFGRKQTCGWKGWGPTQLFLGVIASIHLCSCTDVLYSSFKFGFGMESENTLVRFFFVLY